MPVDPLSAGALVGYVASGAAGALVKSLAEKGASWLIDAARAQSPVVQQKMNANLNNLVKHLAARVERLEAEIPPEILANAMDDPSTALLFRKALMNGSATDNDDRHAVLAAIIENRLRGGAEDMVALIGGGACEIVSTLSEKQMRWLAVLVRIYVLRPSENPEPQAFSNVADYSKACLDWWSKIDILLDGLSDLSNVDIAHLEATGCITFETIVSRNLAELVALRSTPQYQLDYSVLSAWKSWPRIQELWMSRLQKIRLMSYGQIIGIIMHDRLLGERAQINW